MNIQQFRRSRIWYGKSFYSIVLLILVMLVSGRLLQSGFDFSYFIVAGSDFVDASKTPSEIIVQRGQGYDGQFFYRYALNPFDFSQDKYGIHVDLPPYRHQRIIYPLIVWTASFGGNAAMVPVMMVFVNIFAFLGIIYFTRKFIYSTGGIGIHHYFPLLLCGLYMSVARDLSEVCELCFFMGSVYFLCRKNYTSFAFFATLTLLTRETSLLALAPLAGYYFYNNFRSRMIISNQVFLAIPFLILLLWKTAVNSIAGSDQIIPASQNLGIPFIGMIEGFKANLDVSTTKNIFQLIFWLLFFGWQLIFVIKIFRTIFANGHFIEGELLRPLVIIYVIWLIFAICLSNAIYVDDWSFVRVFSLWNMIGFLILIIKRHSSGNAFKIYSVFLVALTIARLIIRV